MEVLKWTDFLNFTLISDTGKTKVIGIGNNSGEKLALIKWRSGWRKYVFEPMPGTAFDTKCLKEITEFIDELMEKRKTK